MVFWSSFGFPFTCPTTASLCTRLFASLLHQYSSRGHITRDADIQTLSLGHITALRMHHELPSALIVWPQSILTSIIANNKPCQPISNRHLHMYLKDLSLSAFLLAAHVEKVKNVARLLPLPFLVASLHSASCLIPVRTPVMTAKQLQKIVSTVPCI